MGILDSIIGAVISPGSGHAITGGFGLILGTGFGAYLHSLKADCEKRNLVIALEHLPKSTAEAVNDNYHMIVESMLQQLDALDDGCELQFNLGSSIRGSIETFCYLTPRPGSEIYQIQKLHEGIKTIDQNSNSTAYAIEKTIDEYFETYLNVNRKVIDSENRAVAVATVQSMRNTSIILIQLMKSIASLPGFENEKRLEKFKAIIDDYFTNILHNKLLATNYNKNLHEYIISTTTQREILANKIQDHYTHLIDQLVIEQRNISIQQLGIQSSIQLHGMTSAFLDLIARLFDSQAGKEFTEITSYKIVQGMLRADTSLSIGMLPFPEKGIYTLLQPLAAIAENLNQLNNQEDVLSFVRYQDLFTNPERLKTILPWSQKYHYKSIPSDEMVLIGEDIVAICKLLFICQALEKDFTQAAIKYGHNGLIERGEYQAKRFIISVLYEEVTQKMSHFFSRHQHVADLVACINDPKWLNNQGIPIIGSGQSYVVSTQTPAAKNILKQDRVVTNSVFRRSVLSLHSLRAKLDYAHDAFLDKHYVGDKHESVAESLIYSKENRIYLFNVVRILQEFGLIDCLGINFSNLTQPPPAMHPDLLSALQVSQYQLQKNDNMIADLSGRLRLQASYSSSKITTGQLTTYSLQFDEQVVILDQSSYQFLKTIAFDDCYWVETSQNKLLNLSTTEQSLQFKLAKDSDVETYCHFYQRLKDIQQAIQQQFQDHNNTAAAAFVNQVQDLMANMQILIEHINLDEENIKKLAANNSLLKSDYTRHQQQIVSLCKDVNSLTEQMDNARASILLLKKSTETNLEKIARIEAVNDEIYGLLLNEFRDNIVDINELNFTLNGKLDLIQDLLKEEQSSKAQQASHEIHNLKQDMRTRIEIILKRFDRYEHSFEKANEEIRAVFISLKKSIGQEKSIIENLEQQLNEALRQLDAQKEKNQFFTAKQGQIRLIVNDFATLFTHLEDTFKPRLNFFSSYRDVKTKNMMAFIDILLANQTFLRETVSHYRSKKDFDRMIDELLDKSTVINAYHGLTNQSVSKKVIKIVIDLWQQDSLVSTLKTDGIPFHDGQIKLSFGGELVYKQIHMPCVVQP